MASFPSFFTSYSKDLTDALAAGPIKTPMPLDALTHFWLIAHISNGGVAVFAFFA
jgi:hypothetical protein